MIKRRSLLIQRKILKDHLQLVQTRKYQKTHLFSVNLQTQAKKLKIKQTRLEINSKKKLKITQKLSKFPHNPPVTKPSISSFSKSLNQVSASLAYKDMNFENLNRT
mmetsp:Transcript_24723/g.27383  ORF Transcript_24723/g.27383 Transcript_24723/m.27383 type:complete len:106 (+) Transcript_24723:3-320(+)